MIREKYIIFIKEYLRKKPDYRVNIDKIKADVALLGASEEEFTIAIQEVNAENKAAVNPDGGYSFHKEQKKIFGFFSPLVLTKILLGILCVVFFSMFVVIKLNTLRLQEQLQSSVKPVLSPSPSPVEISKTGETEVGIIKPVYANEIPISAEKVFSYPPSDVTLLYSAKPKKDVLGFFPYWMLERADEVNFNNLSTVSLFGITVDGKGNIIIARISGDQDGGWIMWNSEKLPPLLTKLRSKNIKVELTIKSFYNPDIEELVASEDGQKRFISNVLHLVGSKNLDGVNIDFEYIGNPTKATRDGFTVLIQNLRHSLSNQFPGSSLTVDTYLSAGAAPGLYDVQVLAEQVDAIVIMAYDVHTISAKAGAVAPMGGDSNVIGYLQNFLEKVPNDKIILAFPYYGYDWSISGNGINKVLSYAEIIGTTKNTNILWDNTTQTPYYNYVDTDKSEHVVHFENVRSLGIKYDLVNSKNLKGVGIWALGYDGKNNDLYQLLSQKFSK